MIKTCSACNEYQTNRIEPYCPFHMPSTKGWVDEYGCLKNHIGSYNFIALYLTQTEKNMIVAWTDEMGTQLDILFSYKPLRMGPLQGDVAVAGDLFVSIMRVGAFGFDIEKDQPLLFPSYVGEKLTLGSGPTTNKVTELLNGVITHLQTL